MRLIDDEVRYAHLPEILERSRRERAFGCGQEELDAAAPRRLPKLLALFPSLTAAQHGTRSSLLAKSPFLVGHQGEEGKNHEGHARQKLRRKLKAKRFSGSGGQDDDLTSSLEGVCHDELLVGEKKAQPGFLPYQAIEWVDVVARREHGDGLLCDTTGEPAALLQGAAAESRMTIVVARRTRFRAPARRRPWPRRRRRFIAGR